MLEVRGLRAGYGAINVLWDVDLDLREGLTAIIGPNGAGKTTLMRAIVGLLPVAAGRIEYDGAPIAGISTAALANQHVTLIPEGRLVFRDMSVDENLRIGAYTVRAAGDVARRLAEAYAMFPRLAERKRQLAGSLSGGEAQMLAMARGLMADPKVLLIDEPSLGLAPRIVDEIFALLRTLKQNGRTIVLVEQNTARAVAVADHVYLMQNGRIVLSQAARDVDLAHLTELYFAH